MPTKTDQETLVAIRRLGVVRPSDLEARGIPRGRIYRLVGLGLVERKARGLYVASDHDPTAEHSLAQVAKKVPKGVICLLSALQYHELTTQLPHEVWLAISEKARRPRIEYPPLRVVRFSGPALTQGVETHKIEGVSVRITSVAKTLADCFKYRNKIGLEVALEALREAWRERKTTIDEIDRSARICRVERVMRPYLEALIT
jgi:predicted transcriptional regulator of viral defense system